MRMKEIMEKVKYNENDFAIYTPNEVFEDLQCQLKDSTHIAYAYSYLYLTNWLYRNCKYAHYFNELGELSNNSIKQILGYNKSNRTMHYITKNKGLLDNIGYTETTKDYPMTSQLDEDENEFEFTTYEDMVVRDSDGKMIDDMLLGQIPKTFFIKRPIKSFERTIKFQNDEGEWFEEDVIGTYNNIENTHTVDFKVFMYFMGNKDLGTVAFYLYSWIKHKNDIFDGYYDVSLEKLAEETGINRSTINKYMKFLKGHKVLDFRHNQEYFVIGMHEDERKSNSYKANDYDMFSDVFVEYKKIRVMDRFEYYNKKKIESGERIEFDLSQLPF